jgi:uncharacterized tellurite resistance protein B-like protein
VSSVAVVNERLKRLYDNVAVHATAQREHEAVVELLLLVMMADRHVSSEEIDSIRIISEESGFESDTFSFDQHLGPASATVRAAIAADDVDGLLDSIDARITSRVLRDSLFAAAREVAGADTTTRPEEADLLAHIAARFG